MGMFDSLYGAGPNEWQTKAFDCNLDIYRLGDPISSCDPQTYQVKVLGDGDPVTGPVSVMSLATVRDGVLVEVPAARDSALPLRDYFGHLVDPANEIQWKDSSNA